MMNDKKINVINVCYEKTKDKFLETLTASTMYQ